MGQWMIRAGRNDEPLHCLRGVFSGLLLAGMMLLSGCGAQAYQERLSATEKYFSYLNKMDANLDSEWEESGVSIRVPEQFSAVRAPEPKLDEDGQPIPSDKPDPRQPEFMEMPGLIGAWRAEVRIDGRDEPGLAELYIVGNHHLLLEQDNKAATEFHGDFVGRLAAALDATVPEQNQWTEEFFPPQAGKTYVTSKAFTATSFTADRTVHGVKPVVHLYLPPVANGVQVAIVWLIPEGIDPREKLDQRIPMSLETVTVSGDRPTKDGESSGGASGF